MAFLTQEQLELDWKTNPRWKGVTRPYSAADPSEGALAPFRFTSRSAHR